MKTVEWTVEFELPMSSVWFDVRAVVTRHTFANESAGTTVRAHARTRPRCYPTRDEPPTEHMASRRDYAVNIAIAATLPAGGRSTAASSTMSAVAQRGRDQEGRRFLNGAPLVPARIGNFRSVTFLYRVEFPYDRSQVS